MWSWLSENSVWLFSGVGTAVLAGLWRWWRRRRDVPKGNEPPITANARVRVCPAPRGRQYNREFYDYFARRLANAKHGIWITGEGFEYRDAEGRGIAEQFVGALRTALKRGVKIVRVQTRANPHEEWVDALARLHRDRKKGDFQLFVLRGAKVAQMSSVCVIDPDEPDDSVVEIMLSTERLFGVVAADLAGTALFIEGDPRLAEDVCGRIRSLTNPEVAIHCHSEEEIREVLGRSQYYFAYGSNMSPEQMVARVPHAERIGIGMLNGYALGFTRRGSYRPGGVASVVRADASRVYGVVWRLTALELASLDEAEDPSAYRRRTAEVRFPDGTPVVAHVYEAIPEGTFAPDREYLKLIISAAEDAGLPSEYVQQVQAWAASAEDEGSRA